MVPDMNKRGIRDGRIAFHSIINCFARWYFSREYPRVVVGILELP